MKYNHLSFEDRVLIEKYLDEGYTINKISEMLGRSRSSIAREIQRNRKPIKPPERVISCSFVFNCNQHYVCGDRDCKRTCAQCYEGCKEGVCVNYKPRSCDRLNKAPFVCNNCNQCTPNSKGHYFRYIYDAQHAQHLYDKVLKTSRSGIELEPEKMDELDNLVSPLLKKGQSIYAIVQNHPGEIPVSSSTLYRYVDRCYLSARNIDLSRKVRFKKRYSHGRKEKIYQEFVLHRTYSDFQAFVDENPDASIWEMDTVIGSQNGQKSFLTLLSRRTSLMLIFLLDRHTQDCVVRTLNNISEAIGIKRFQQIFSCIITDRGTEFSNPYALECDDNGEIKTKVFYCDPYRSSQKGMIEKNHEFIRMILPKGYSFDNLSQYDATRIANHINSYPREALNGNTPYSLARMLIGKDFLEKMNCKKIPEDLVTLRPSLLYQSPEEE